MGGVNYGIAYCYYFISGDYYSPIYNHDRVKEKSVGFGNSKNPAYLKGQLDEEHTQRMILESKNRSLMVEKVLTAIKQIEMAFNKIDVKVSDIELNL